MQDQPKITIGITTYNRPNFLKAAVASVIKQSYQNFATPYGYPQPTHIYYPDPNNMPIQFLSQGGPYGNPSGAHPQTYNIYSNWQGQTQPQCK